MTRRDLFARLAGLGVPYVATAMPPALKPGDVFTMASVNVTEGLSIDAVRAFDRHETWYAPEWVTMESLRVLRDNTRRRPSDTH